MIFIDVLLIFEILIPIYSIGCSCGNPKERKHFTLPGMWKVYLLIKVIISIGIIFLNNCLISYLSHFIDGISWIISGIIVLFILMITYLVRSKGCRRAITIAAGFAEDSLPGQLMSIESDYVTGAITEAESETKSENLIDDTKRFTNEIKTIRKYISYKGDLLYLRDFLDWEDMGIRAQGVSVYDDDVIRAIDFAKNKYGGAQYNKELCWEIRVDGRKRRKRVRGKSLGRKCNCDKNIYHGGMP